MRAVVQRVRSAAVEASGGRRAEIGGGLLVLLGVAAGDGPAEAEALAAKIAELRVFEDETGKMNRALVETGGAALVVSQFTLLGDCAKGRRPDFTRAARPELAEPLYRRFVEALAARGVPVQTGFFREAMQVTLVNDGPVTLLLEREPKA